MLVESIKVTYYKTKKKKMQIVCLTPGKQYFLKSGVPVTFKKYNRHHNHVVVKTILGEIITISPNDIISTDPYPDEEIDSLDVDSLLKIATDIIRSN